MSAVVPFAFNDSLVRAVWRNGDPWFVAKDVCGALGLEKYRDAIARLDDDERGSLEVDTPGGRQHVAAVSEGGLYTLILRCRDATKPGTVPHRFRRWVTGEVLRSLRRTGAYTSKGTPAGAEPDAAIRERELRLETVAEARRLYGPERARHLWRELGLPDVPGLASGSVGCPDPFVAEPVAETIHALASETVRWTGTCGRLFRELPLYADERTRRASGWPQTVQGLGTALTRFAPLLRHRGVEITRRHSGVRTVTIVLAELRR